MEKIDRELFDRLRATRRGFQRDLAVALGFTSASAVQKMLGDGYGFSRRGQESVARANKTMREWEGGVSHEHE